MGFEFFDSQGRLKTIGSPSIEGLTVVGMSATSQFNLSGTPGNTTGNAFNHTFTNNEAYNVIVQVYGRAQVRSELINNSLGRVTEWEGTTESAIDTGSIYGGWAAHEFHLDGSDNAPSVGGFSSAEAIIMEKPIHMWFEVPTGSSRTVTVFHRTNTTPSNLRTTVAAGGWFRVIDIHATFQRASDTAIDVTIA